jgi:hypothetical protein
MDVALKEIAEGKIAYKLPDREELAAQTARSRKRKKTGS